MHIFAIFCNLVGPWIINVQVGFNVLSMGGDGRDNSKGKFYAIVCG